jgi:hypothetical protein
MKVGCNLLATCQPERCLVSGKPIIWTFLSLTMMCNALHGSFGRSQHEIDAPTTELPPRRAGYLVSAACRGGTAIGLLYVFRVTTGIAPHVWDRGGVS